MNPLRTWSVLGLVMVTGLLLAVAEDINGPLGPGGGGQNLDGRTNVPLDTNCVCYSISLYSQEEVCKGCCFTGRVDWGASGDGVLKVTCTSDPPNLAYVGFSCGSEPYVTNVPCSNGLANVYVMGRTAGRGKLVAALWKDNRICASNERTLTVVDLLAATGFPQEVLVDSNVTFTAVVAPPDYAGGLIRWSGGGTPAVGSGLQFTTRWSDPGVYVVTARCGTATNCGAWVTATATVLKVDILDPAENDVHLKGEEVKFDGEVEPTGLSGATYAWSVLEGTCDPATATTEDFQTTLKSAGTIKVKLAVTVGGTTCEKIRTIKAMLPYPTHLNFKGTSNTRIRNIGTDPEWTKTDKTTKNYAVYDKQTTADVEARFEATEALTENTEVKVKASGNKESFEAANAYFHNWSWAEDELVLESSELYASINFYDTLDLTWKYIVRKLDGSWPDWSEAVTMGGDNPTTHIIYTVMKTPVKRDRSAGRGHDEYTQAYYDTTCRKLEGYTGNDDDHVATEMMQWIEDNLTWTGNCHYLAAFLAAFNHTQGVTAYQYWLDHKPKVIGGGSGAVGDFECQRTISIDPVPIGGGSQAYTFNFHSFNRINGSVYDPTTNTKKTGWTVQQYEDWLMTKYAKCLRDYEKCYAMGEDPPDPDDPQYEWKDNVIGTMEPENYEHILWEVIP